MLLRAAFQLLAMCAFLLSFSRVRADEPLVSVAEVRALAPSAVAAHRPVRLSGVVTYLRDAAAGVNFILDDGTGGVMIYPQPRPPTLQPGQRVTAEGTTQKDKLLLSIVSTKLLAGEMERLPTPLPATAAEVFSGKFDGRFVEIEETVRVVRVELPQLKPQRLALDLGPRSRRLNAWLSRWEGSENRFAPGARVRLRGVAVRWHNDRSQPVSTSLLVNSPDDAEVLAPASAQVPQSLAEVLWWTGAAEQTAPVVTSGVVTYHRPGELLFLEADGRALRVKPAPPDALNGGQTQPHPQPGDRVEVTGFPAMGDYTTELEDAWLRVLDAPGKPAATDFADAAALLAPSGIVDRDARLVRLAATVRDVRERDGRRAVELTSAGRDFTAWLPAEADLPEQIRAGAEVRVTGICTLILRDEARRFGRPPETFSLLLADREALEIVRPAPWWTPRRLFAVIGAFAGIALLAALWAIFLRKRNALLRQEIAARKRAEMQLSIERRRVAADLHDTLEQTLLAANLQLTAAARAPENSAPLTLAQQLLARGQQEVREAVWDLRMDTAEPLSLPTLLARACTEAGSLAEAAITFAHAGTEAPLPALVIAQSVRLVREAVTNALKHARPERVVVKSETTGAQVRLTITDDGRGFDVAKVAGPETGHFGLTGMRERVQRLGGTLEIQSSPGRGTTILAIIPTA